MCVIGLPCPYGSGEVSYITSHHVLGDIIQPAGVGLLQIITGTGVYFIPPINALQSWYSTPPFDSFCFLSFPTSPSRHNKKKRRGGDFYRHASYPSCLLSILVSLMFSRGHLRNARSLRILKERGFFEICNSFKPACILNWDVHPSLCALCAWRTAWAFSRISSSPCSHTI